MATKRTAGLLAGCVVAAIVAAGLLTTCEETVKSSAESSPAVVGPAAETATTKAVAPRRARKAKAEAAGEGDVAESSEVNRFGLVDEESFVVVAVEVLDAETDRPVPGAAFTDRSRIAKLLANDENDAVTDEIGRAAIRCRPDAIVRVATHAAGHVGSTDYVRTAPVGAAQPSLRVELVPGGTLHGVVRDPDGNPAQESVVDVRSPHVGGVLQSEPSGADGTYVVEGLSLGSWYTAAANDSTTVADACASADSTVLVATKERPVVVADLRLRRYGTMVLTVLDGETVIDDSLAIKLSVRLSNDDSVTFQSGGGANESTFVVPGKYSLAVWFEDRAVVRETVDVPEGGTVKKTIHLTRGETIAGLVVDDAGAPVEDAWIRDGAPPEDVREPRAVTQSRADGTFELTQLTTGDHELRVSPPFEFDDIVVRAAAPAENVRLVVPRRGVLKLRAVFDGDAKPAADARIAFHGTLDGKPWDIDRTLPQGGRFEIAWPAGVSGDVGIAVDGFVPVTRNVTVTAGATVDLGEIRMQPACALSGVVRNEDGFPMNEATLVVRSTMGDRKCKTAADGRFSFRGLSSGPLRLDLAETPHASFLVDVPSVKDVVLVLPKSGLLQVFASNASGQRLAARRVDVVDADGVTVDGGTTDANGSWTSHLAPGRYSVDVENGPRGKADVRADDVTVLRLR